MKTINSIEDLRKCRKTDAIAKTPHRVHDAVLLGDWDEVQDIPAETLRKWTDKPDELTGLILKGYEMKWNTTNENGEQYEKTAFDDFVQRYFVDRELNMPVDINHEGWNNWHAYCGRVLYLEVNSVGFYFVVNIPREFEGYDDLKWRLQNGIIQGFSKEGWATDWEPRWKEDGSFDYELIKKMDILSVSLVSTPANGIAFERMQEVRNALIYKNKITEEKGKTIAQLFK
jgi:HK97 family phage prohead protease